MWNSLINAKCVSGVWLCEMWVIGMGVVEEGWVVCGCGMW